jgi:predicted phosphodiesterase
MKIAFIADLHEDVVNLKLALYKIESLCCDEIVCLGDISGFSAQGYKYFNTRDARECLHLVRENCKYIIAGNHDLHAVRRLPGYCGGFDFPPEWYSLDYIDRKALGYKKVWLYDHDELDPLYTQADKEYLAGLPELELVEVEGMRILLCHYLYPNLCGALMNFYHTHIECQQHFSFMESHGCDLSFSGHHHGGALTIATKDMIIERQFRRKYIPEDRSAIIVPSITGNAGSSGFCIFDTVEHSVKAVRV